ncbi:MAG: tetratricopeptide repeat protein [Candidatus Melainabacteria bacterium]|nr:tetratricopeptide repeat protein [Candidatus Melainabacteria bacterium]
MNKTEDPREYWKVFFDSFESLQAPARDREGRLKEAISDLELSVERRNDVLAYAFLCLGELLRDQQRYEEAGEHYERAQSLIETRAGKANLSDHCHILENRADFLCETGDFARALELRREALHIAEQEDVRPLEEIAMARLALASIAMVLKDFVSAAKSYEEALETLECLPDRESFVITGYSALAGLYYLMGRFEESEAYTSRAIALADATSQSESRLNMLALALCAQGRHDEARPICESARQVCGETGTDPDAAAFLSQLADVYCLQRRFDEAEALCKEAFFQREKALGSPNPSLASRLATYSFLLLQEGRDREAFRIQRRLESVTGGSVK